MAEILTVTPTDYQELASFLANFHPETESPAFWLNNFQHWWDDNPAFAVDLDRGWLLRENGKIVGFLGSIPTCFMIDGENLTVFNSTTWRVLPEARHQSMNLLSKLLGISKHSILFNTTPNEEVAQILRALKFQPLPGPDENRRSLVIINFEKVALSKLKKRPARIVLAKVVGPLLNLIQRYRLKRLAAADSVCVKQISEIDSSFDQLWLRTKDLYRNTNLRTAEIINWYCFKNKDLQKTAFGCYKNGQLYGYAIFETRLSKRHNLTIMECLDLWFDPAENHTITSLIKATQDYAQTQGVDLISFPHFNPRIDQYFNGLGLFQMKVERNEYFKANARLAQHITPDKSYFVGLQGDAGLA